MESSVGEKPFTSKHSKMECSNNNNNNIRKRDICKDLKGYTKSNHASMEEALLVLNAKTNNHHHESGNGYHKRTAQSPRKVKSPPPLSSATRCSERNTGETSSMQRQQKDTVWQRVLNKQEKTTTPWSHHNPRTVSYASHFQKTSWPELDSQRAPPPFCRLEETGRCRRPRPHHLIHSISFANMLKDGRSCGREEAAVDMSHNDDRHVRPASDKDGTDIIAPAAPARLPTDAAARPPCPPGEEARADKKQKRKMGKMVKKIEMRRKREEELRRRLTAPKDQHVTIINHDLVVKYFPKADTKVAAWKPEDHIWEFPELGNTRRKQQQQQTEKGETEMGSGKGTEDGGGGSRQEAGQQMGEATPIPRGGEKEKTPVGKKPKTKDPIQVDILEAIKTSEQRQLRQEKAWEGRGADGDWRHHSRRSEVAPYCGNLLDSSHPERKRGKFREQPRPKKLSKLKSVILEERTLRKNAIRLAILHRLCLDTHQVDQINRYLRRIHLHDQDATAKGAHTLPDGNNNQEAREDPAGALLEGISLPAEEPAEIQGELEQEGEAAADEGCHAIAVSPAIAEICSHDNVSVDHIPSPPPCPGKDQLLGEVSAMIANGKNDDGIWSRSAGTGASVWVQNADVAHETEQTVSDRGDHPDSHALASPCGMTRIIVPQSEWSQLVVKPNGIHSRRFREYCDHSLTPELNATVESLLHDIIKFHDQQYARNPLKTKRRHVTGLKEVKKFLGLRKLKLVVIAPDLEKIENKGGLNDKVEELKAMARLQELPYVFAMNRKALGRVLIKKVPVSCVGIVSYEGADQTFSSLMGFLDIARQQYKELTKDMTQETEETVSHDVAAECPHGPVDVNKLVIASFLAKLTEKAESESESSPFLRAIESHTHRDDKQEEEEAGAGASYLWESPQ